MKKTINIHLLIIFVLFQFIGCFDNNKLANVVELLSLKDFSSSKEQCLLKRTPESVKLNSINNNTNDEGDTSAISSKNIWSLFDSNTDSVYTASQSRAYAIYFGDKLNLKKIKIFGSTTYKVNIYAGWDDDKKIISQLCIDENNLKDSWNNLYTDELVNTDIVYLEIIPRGESGIREIEFWSEEHADFSETGIQYNIARIKQYNELEKAARNRAFCVNSIESPVGEISISNNADENNTAKLHVSLPLNPIIIDRAYISYMAKNIPTSLSIERRINNLSWVGGYDVPEKTTGTNGWIGMFEEINPEWLASGDNIVEFKTKNDNVSIKDFKVVYQTDSGWNRIKSCSKSDVIDSNIGTYASINIGDTIEIEFVESIEPETIMLYLPSKTSCELLLNYLNNGRWCPVKSGDVIDLSKMSTGWNKISLPVPVFTPQLQLQFVKSDQQNVSNENVKIGEVRISGSPVHNSKSEPQVVVSYPRNGEYYGRTAFINGFISSDIPAQVTVEGKSAEQKILDNSFSFILSKDETRFSIQNDDDLWTPIVKAVNQQYNINNKIVLNKNLLSDKTGESTGSGSTSGQDNENSGATNGYSADVYPDSAKTITYGPLTIEIPAGAVDGVVTITIIPLTNIQLAKLNPGMINVTYPAAGYRFLINGKPHYSFIKPIHVSFAYGKDLLLQGQGDNDVFMYFYDEQEKTWKRLHRIVNENQDTTTTATATVAQNISVRNNVMQSSSSIGFITSETTHFTDIINATITIPEHPDPLLYNPNSIKDLKVGNPTEGIQIIAPPAANNRADVNLSYPIDIPQGRNNMQPQLALFYNSEHQNGLLGVGWDLPINSIIIDTKFGVPRYNGNETYNLNINNTQVSIAHVGNNIYRSRVEGSFVKIIRHGDACNNFWWEVIDKNGTRYIYGMSDNARLKNYYNTDGVEGNNGNIYMWCIEKVIDANNNNIRYGYYHDLIKSDDGEPSTSIYPLKITYTGSYDNDGRYSIKFTIDNTSERSDKLINCRGGFKIETRYLLKSVEICYDSNSIRKYNFIYKQGPFNKSLLEKVEQYGKLGKLFTTHAIEYYDDLTHLDDSTHKGFSEGTRVSNEMVYKIAPTSGMKGKNLDGGSISAISSERSSGIFTLAWGHQASHEYFFIRKGHYEHESKTLIKLLDIDGDGLNDQVFVEDGKMLYRKNLGLVDNNIKFGEALEIDSLRNVVDSIYHDKGKSSLSGHFMYIPNPVTLDNPLGIPNIYGDGNSSSSSDSISYFQDINGDGLPDLVVGYRVYYNTPDKSGKPVFLLDRPAGFGSDNDKLYIGNTKIGDSQTTTEDYRYDPILMWEAPYDGAIKITGIIRTFPHGQYSGYNFTIQVNNEQPICILHEYDFYYPYYIDLEKKIPNSITVSRGDRIYFRLNSTDKNESHYISIDPEIQYVNDNYNLDLVDENNLEVFKYNALSDFLAFGDESSFSPPVAGTIDFKGTLGIKDRLSDDIGFKLFKTDSSGIRNEIFSRTFPCNGIGDYNIDYNSISVSIGDSIEYELISDTEIDWSRVSITPSLIYSDIEGLDAANDENGDPIYSFELPVCIKNYPIKEKDPVNPFVAPKDGKIRVLYETSFLGNLSMPLGYNADVTLAVKKQKELIVKVKKTINAEFTDELTLEYEMDVQEGDTLYFVCASNKYDFSSYLLLGVPRIYYESDNGRDGSGEIQQKIAIESNSQVYRFRDSEHPFAGGLRSWYFGRWNGKITTLDPSLMKAVDAEQFDEITADNYEEKLSKIDEQMETFSPMYLKNQKVLQSVGSFSSQGQKETVYVGNDDISLIGKVLFYDYTQKQDNPILLMSTSYYSQDEVADNLPSDVEGDYLSSEYRGIVKSTGKGTSTGYGQYNYRIMKSDLVDLNGDLYPDYITNVIQFTKQDGSLEDTPKEGAYGLTESSWTGAKLPETKENGLFHIYSNSDLTVNGIVGQTKETIKLYHTSLIDINGDGLPDNLSGNSVSYNEGYKFSKSTKLAQGSLSWENILNTAIDGELLPYVGSFRGILSFGSSVSEGYTNEETSGAHDFNGDGLPDKVSINSDKIQVYINTGKGISNNASEFYSFDNDAIDTYSGITKGLDILSFNTWQYLGFFVVAAHDAGSLHSNTKWTTEIIDINGDNLPDIVRTDENGEMVVYLNKTGRTNLLKKITNPLGSSYTLDYEQKGNTFNMPKSKWTLSRLTVNNGSGSEMETSYVYGNGNYDKKEREFYGYDEMTETRPDGSKVLHKFHSNDYYLKGIEYETELRDKDDRPFVRTKSEYDVREIADKIKFPYLKNKTTYYHEGNPDIVKFTTQTFEYDDYGNIITYSDNGDEGAADDIITKIGYKYDLNLYIVNKPNLIQVKDANNNVYRMRTCIYNEQGNMTKLLQFNEPESESVTDIDYYTNGTIQNIWSPPNQKDQKYKITYTYDENTQSHIANISDSIGNISHSTYYDSGKIKTTSDLNNNTTEYIYDEFGRLVAVNGPQNDNGAAKIDIEYNINNQEISAKTTNRSGSDGDAITITSYADGLGRIIKKSSSAEVSGESATVSTDTRYNNMGQVVSETQPYTTSPSGSIDYTYDVLGRTLSVRYPDKSYMYYQYGFATPPVGTGMLFCTTVQDQLGKETKSYTDMRSLVRFVQETKGPASEYEYNIMGEITGVVEDALGRKIRTYITYDKQGRRTSIDNQDTGLIRYAYDLAGNLKEKETHNLRAEGKSILYEYDNNRLSAINYPDSEDVHFVYGGSTEGGNRRGRIMRISTGQCSDDVFTENDSFKEFRTYDSLGNVSEITRSITVTIPVPNVITKTTKYSFDGFGRMKNMTFPDGEIISYQYDGGGMLKKITGANPSYEYVSNITYDAYGQRESITYGNGVTTKYEYTDDLHRLDLLESTINGKTIQNVRYEYDAVGNITKRANSGFTTTGEETGSSEQTYGYDPLYRLTSSRGAYSGTKGVYSYSSAIVYDSVNNITSKIQVSEFEPTSGTKSFMNDSTYNYSYSYGSTRPHAVTSTGDTTYQYDGNGNMLARISPINPAAVLALSWNEENRMKRSIDSGSVIDYKYDDAGKRIVKKNATSEVVYINDNYSIRNGDVVSKHIFAGNTRVVTKLDTGNSEPGIYYYHGDNLGSSNVVTNKSGGFHENIEYFPYGETWVQEKASNTQESMPYKFTSKEEDETGLYYFGARYYEPKMSKWMSTDPAMEKYLPGAGKGSDGLPGMGGVYNPNNMNVYEYAGNNPSGYIDPDGSYYGLGGVVIPIRAPFDTQETYHDHIAYTPNPREEFLKVVCVEGIAPFGISMGLLQRVVFGRDPYTGVMISNYKRWTEGISAVLTFGASKYLNFVRTGGMSELLSGKLPWATNGKTIGLTVVENFIDYTPTAISIGENYYKSLDINRHSEKHSDFNLFYFEKNFFKGYNFNYLNNISNYNNFLSNYNYGGGGSSCGSPIYFGSGINF